MSSKLDYLNYVDACLKSIPEDVEIKASYDTGYGIHITSEDLGYSPMTFIVVNYSVCKIKPPTISDFDQWEEAWKSGKDMIHKFISKRK